MYQYNASHWEEQKLLGSQARTALERWQALDYQSNEAELTFLRNFIIDAGPQAMKLKDFRQLYNAEIAQVVWYNEKYGGSTPTLSRKQAIRLLHEQRALWQYEFSRDEYSEFAMGMSLCPLHFLDWAICFDDENPECSQIREVFPVGHDT